MPSEMFDALFFGEYGLLSGFDIVTQITQAYNFYSMAGFDASIIRTFPQPEQVTCDKSRHKAAGRRALLLSDVGSGQLASLSLKAATARKR